VEDRLPPGALHVQSNSQIELRRMLVLGMADVALCMEPDGDPLLQGAGMRMLRLSEPLGPVFLHHVLAARHRQLADRVDAELALMAANGELAAMLQQARAAHEADLRASERAAGLVPR